MNAFAKKEPITAPGPALVAGVSEEEPITPLSPITPAAPTISLSGELAAPIARDYAVGDDFNGTGAFRVTSIGEDGNVELELVSLTPSGEPSDASAEEAIDSYLTGKGAAEEEELV